MLALAMTVGGIYVLIKGEIVLTADKVVRGWKARLIGGLLASYFPVAVAAGLALGLYCAVKQVEFTDNFAYGIDVGVMAFLIVSSVILGVIWGRTRAELDEEARLAADPNYIPPGAYNPNQALPPPSDNPYQSPFNR